MIKRRAHFEANQIALRNAYLKLIGDNAGAMPTMRQLADETKLSLKTVVRHIKEIRFKPAEHKARLLTNDVLQAIYETATKKKDPRAQKLWAQIMEGWVEKKDITSDGEALKPANIIVSQEAAGLIEDAVKDVTGEEKDD